MKQLRIVRLCGVFLFCLAVFMGLSVAFATEALGEGPRTIRTAPEVLPSEIRGTVRINGWTGTVANAFIHAMPVSFGSSTGTQAAPKRPGVEHINPLRRTADPHVFSFSVRGLMPHTPYKLGITFPPNPVRPKERIKTFWGGLSGGVATSGAPPVAIEGYVANTEVEVKDSNGNWVGADDLQHTDPEAALRTLRWKSTIQGVVAGELQISLRPFPAKGDFGSCDEPAGGVIYRKQFPVRGGEWQEIGSVDFRSILTPGRTSPPRDDEIPPGTSPTDDITIGASSSDDVSPVSEMDLKMLALGAPVYVRVVPVTERGRACDIREAGVHGWVIMAKVAKVVAALIDPPPPPEVSHLEVLNQTYTPPTIIISAMDDDVRRAGGAVYKVIKQHKLPPCKTKDYYAGWTGCNLKNGFPDYISYEYNKTTGHWDKVHKKDEFGQLIIDGTGNLAVRDLILSEGQVFNFQIFYSSSCDWWCGAWDFASGFVTGLTNGIGGFVTWWAEAFQSIKSGVASVVADVVQVLPGVGALCKASENIASCKSIIQAGMDYGLASMGLPPSLPNWEQLKAQGMDYFAAEVSGQMASATGLPPDITNLAADKALELSKGMAQKTIDAMTENRGKAFNGWGANWVLPFDGIEPASRTIKVVKKYAGGPPYAPFPLPSNLYLRTTGFGSFTDLFVNGSFDPFIANLYRPEDVHVPEFPHVPLIIDGKGTSLNIPIVLKPDYSTIPVPQCTDTMPAYNVKCSAVHLLPDNPFQPNSPSCWKSYGGYSPWQLVDCKNYEVHIAIYYRDYWIENRLDDLENFECLRLSAVANTYNWFEDILGLNPWHLFDPPFGTFAFTPSKEAKTWEGPFYANPKCQ